MLLLYRFYMAILSEMKISFSLPLKPRMSSVLLSSQPQAMGIGRYHNCDAILLGRIVATIVASSAESRLCLHA